MFLEIVRGYFFFFGRLSPSSEIEENEETLSRIGRVLFVIFPDTLLRISFN